MARKKTTTGKSRQKRNVSASTRGGTGRGRSSSGRKRSSSKRSQSGRSGRSRRSRSPQRKRTPASFRLNVQQKALVIGISLIFLTAILVLSLLSPNQGSLTLGLEQVLARGFGWGRWFVPLGMAAGGFYLVLWGMDQPPRLPGWRVTGIVLLFLVFVAFASLLTVARFRDAPDLWAVARESDGGYLGGLLALLAIRAVDTAGAIFLFLVLGIVGTVLVSGLSRADMGHFVAGLLQRREKATPATGEAPRPAQMPLPLRRRTPGEVASAPAAAEDAIPFDPGEPAPAEAGAAAHRAQPEAPAGEAERSGRRSRRRRRDEPTAAPPVPAGPTPVILGHTPGAGPSWELPPLADILEAGTEQDVSYDSIREQVEIIEHTLESFGAPANVVDINQGPTVTQFGVEPQFIETRGGKRTKVKVGKIASLADDLALALAAHSVRIQAPVPGKGYVGIEVPNVAKAVVSLRDIMESPEFQKINSPLRIGLGQNVAGQPVATDLTKMPHMLIAGTTGSGKSVCVNSIIAGLLLQNTPEDLRIVMVDPKRVELTGYNGIPHLAAPVVVDMDRVIGTLQWAMREMESRYRRFAESGSRNIGEYNKKMKRERQPKLPHIVIVVDELADLMMLSPEETERGVSRLAQMARATGMHMIIATQRPSVDVVTGLIKANFPARIAFAVASSTDSRVILDSTGAERLLGRGDMLFQSPDAAAPVRLQGCFVSDEELTRLIDYWRTARRYNLITAADARPRRSLIDERTVPLEPDDGAAEPVETAGSPGVTTATAPAAPPSNGSATRRPATEPDPAERASLAASQAPDGAAPEAAAEAVDRTEIDLEETAEVTPDRTAPQQPLWEDLVAQAQDEPEDELLPQAIALVRQLDKASTSLLQRRFRIGYTRAARIIDVMEEQGIIGPPTGTSKAREVFPVAGAATPGEAGDGDEADDGRDDDLIGLDD